MRLSIAVTTLLYGLEAVALRTPPRNAAERDNLVCVELVPSHCCFITCAISRTLSELVREFEIVTDD